MRIGRRALSIIWFVAELVFVLSLIFYIYLNEGRLQCLEPQQRCAFEFYRYTPYILGTIFASGIARTIGAFLYFSYAFPRSDVIPK